VIGSGLASPGSEYRSPNVTPEHDHIAHAAYSEWLPSALCDRADRMQIIRFWARLSSAARSSSAGIVSVAKSTQYIGFSA
jgi:hypothetical protein